MSLQEGRSICGDELVVDPAYAGLPEIVHGGYVAGLLTAALGADSSRVRLRRPVPTARELRLERPGAGQLELHGDAGLLADAVESEVLLDVPEPVSASRAWPITRSRAASAAVPRIRAAWACSPGPSAAAPSWRRSGCRRGNSRARAARCRRSSSARRSTARSSGR